MSVLVITFLIKKKHYDSLQSPFAPDFSWQNFTPDYVRKHFETFFWKNENITIQKKTCKTG